MKDYREIINDVSEGARFFVDFRKRTLKLKGKYVDLSIYDFPPLSEKLTMLVLNQLYRSYKHSVPSERSESHRRYYFKALPEKSLTDSDMAYGELREVARCRLEVFVLFCLYHRYIEWKDDWGKWFWQSDEDKDLILLREWVEPKQDGV